MMTTGMTTSPVLKPLVLTAEEREVLERWTRRPKTSQALALRARVLLACADGMNNTDVGIALRVHRTMVARWRSRFLAKRLNGLLDEPRPGAPRTISDAEVERVIARTLETKPRDSTHWSTRSMARELGMSQSAISRIWRAFSLQPHRSETFKLSKDPLFIEKVRDIVGLYLSPPERALVLCVDEKSQIQALQRAQPILPMDFGQPERRVRVAPRQTLDRPPKTSFGCGIFATAQMPGTQRIVAARIERIPPQRLAPIQRWTAGRVAILIQVQACYV